MLLISLKKSAISSNTKEIKISKTGFSLKNFGTSKGLVRIKQSLLRRRGSILIFLSQKRTGQRFQKLLQLIKFLTFFHSLEFLNGLEFHLEIKKHTDFKRVYLVSLLKQERLVLGSGVRFMELKRTITLQKVQRKQK
jgi:hypothetical protein